MIEQERTLRLSICHPTPRADADARILVWIDKGALSCWPASAIPRHKPAFDCGVYRICKRARSAIENHIKPRHLFQSHSPRRRIFAAYRSGSMKMLRSLRGQRRRILGIIYRDGISTIRAARRPIIPPIIQSLCIIVSSSLRRLCLILP
jgi:hypothetical protein